ncbi:MAG: hypothetical protein M1147_07425 [Nitrospirae bacterium]|nr:hypothetical protein [Nitrospirota bacterium]MCL5977942.1 hypothetical protein [Nitrospirota bacterium]
MIKKIAAIFLLLLFCSVSSSYAEQSENKSSAQKQKASVKKKILKIKHGEVYPGDAAVAGHEEETDAPKAYKIKGGKMTYIFSRVEGYEPGKSRGYFRVLEYYGIGRGGKYGREDAKDKRDRLFYAELTPTPSRKNAMQQVGAYIVLFFEDDDFGVYDTHRNKLFYLSYSKEWLPLGIYVPEQEITDIDGDGNIEIKAFVSLKGTIKNPGGRSNILSIYRYIPYDKQCSCQRFVLMKGKIYEKIFIEHANKMKENGDIKAWLGTIANIEDPELIKKTLTDFWKLPTPDDKNKQRIIELLTINGFLKPDDKNP